MSEAKENISPFAEKLKHATVGRTFPKATPSEVHTRAKDSGVRHGGRRGRENSVPPAREGVSGTVVHARMSGAGADASILEHREAERGVRSLDELRTNIEESHALLLLLEKENAGTVVVADVDGMSFAEYVAAEYDRAKAILDADPVEITPGNIDELQAIHDNFRGFISDIQEQLPEPATAGVPRERRNRTKHPKSHLEKGSEVTSPHISASVEAKPDVGIEAQLTKLRALMDRWRTLQSEFSGDALSRETRKTWTEGDVPMKKAGDWVNVDTDAKKWSPQRRDFFVQSVLYPMEQWMTEAERAAAKLRLEGKKPKAARRRQQGTRKVVKKRSASQAAGDPSASPVSEEMTQREPGMSVAAAEPAESPQNETIIEPTTVTSDRTSVNEQDEAEIDVSAGTPTNTDNVITLTGRRVEGDGLTAWERMDVGEQNQILRRLFTEKDSFMTELNATLRKAGGGPAIRERVIMNTLRQYLEQLIPLCITEMTLTPSDTEDIMTRLLKERAIKP